MNYRAPLGLPAGGRQPAGAVPGHRFPDPDEISPGQDLAVLNRHRHRSSPCWQKDRSSRPLQYPVVLHGVRTGKIQLSAADRQFAEQHGRRFAYVPPSVRETWPEAMAGRIPAAIVDGKHGGEGGAELLPELEPR